MVPQRCVLYSILPPPEIDRSIDSPYRNTRMLIIYRVEPTQLHHNLSLFLEITVSLSLKITPKTVVLDL